MRAGVPVGIALLRGRVRRHADRPEQLRHLRPCLRRQRGVHGRILRAAVPDGLCVLPHRLRPHVLPAHLALGARLLPTPGSVGDVGILLRRVYQLTATPPGARPAGHPPEHRLDLEAFAATTEAANKLMA